jgi:hypothetical protein
MCAVSAREGIDRFVEVLDRNALEVTDALFESSQFVLKISSKLGSIWLNSRQSLIEDLDKLALIPKLLGALELGWSFDFAIEARPKLSFD